MTFKDNPAFVEEFHSRVHDVRFYGPAQATDYHMKRYVAAQAQDLYSSIGATKETLQALLGKMLELVNSDKPVATFRSDVGVLANNILSRTKYPVDEDCAIRMGAIYTFMEGEDPNDVADHWTQRKVDLARKDPDLYAFFLARGLANTPAYANLLSTLTDTDLRARAEMIAGLTLQSQSPT